MEIAYTAHTETCTLLLDAEGVCRSVLAVSTGGRSDGRPARIPSSAEKCIGAQYVACLDLREAGGMASLPKPGAQMLFARTEANGRITLVRSAPVVHFVPAVREQVESGVHPRPEVSYGADDELTIPMEPPTHRWSSPPPPSAPPAPLRPSGIVPAGTAPRATVPPPPPRVERPAKKVEVPRPRAPSQPTPPAYDPPSDLSVTKPRRTSIVRATMPSVRATMPSWEGAETQPFKRAARR
jgi:hypothetical protein